MSKLKLIGKVFGRLTVVSENGRNVLGQVLWNCICSCGNTCVKASVELSSKGVRSCGCLVKERASELGRQSAKHNMSRTKAYQAWSDAKQRCYNENHPEYKRYGGIGIKMSDELRSNPELWCSHLGNPPDNEIKWSVDRIDTTKNYEIGNLR